MTDTAEVYDFLIKEALSRAKLGRSNLHSSQKKFYENIFILSKFIAGMPLPAEVRIALESLADYPCDLRAVLDAQDEANDLLGQARQMRQVERMRTDPI